MFENRSKVSSELRNELIQTKNELLYTRDVLQNVKKDYVQCQNESAEIQKTLLNKVGVLNQLRNELIQTKNELLYTRESK
jgi:uncharacterized coiled-coil DUF342 family protein